MRGDAMDLQSEFDARSEVSGTTSYMTEES